MDYDPRLANHNLPHDPFTSLVVPRPIGWISTVNADGVVNLAPYSFFNIVSYYCVMFGSAPAKHSQTNAEASGEFTVSMATLALREDVNDSSADFDAGVSEPERLGIEMAPSLQVKPPRVAASPVALECRYVQTVPLPGRGGRPSIASLVLGEVIGVHIDDAIIVDGMVDVTRALPLSRLGYMEYGVLDRVFRLPRPTDA